MTKQQNKTMIRLLDVTLRDGGLVCNHEWGKEVIHELASSSVRSGSDIIEFGYMRNEEFCAGRAIFNNVHQVDAYTVERGLSEFALMIELPQYDIQKLDEYNGGRLKHIRIVFKPRYRENGLRFARIAKEKGYKVHINPTGFAGYSKQERLQMVFAVNEIQPFTFTTTDTYGILDLPRLQEVMADVHGALDPNIAMGLHLHNNAGLAYALAQFYIGAYHDKRDISVDASMAGLGRTAGNLSLELIMGFLNRYYDTCYDITKFLDIESRHILPLLAEHTARNSRVYYALASLYGLHPSCAEEAIKNGNSLCELYDNLTHAPENKKVIYDK